MNFAKSKQKALRGVAAAVIGLALGCAEDEPKNSSIELGITNAPADARCLRITVVHPRVTDRFLFSLKDQEQTIFLLPKVPAGRLAISGDAFSTSCQKVKNQTESDWTSDAVFVNAIDYLTTNASIVLKRNARVRVTSDFEVDPDGGISDARTDVVP